MKYTKELHNELREAIENASMFIKHSINTDAAVAIIEELERLQAENAWHKYPDEKPETMRLVEVQGESDNPNYKGCDLTWFISDDCCVSWHVKNIKQWRYFQPPAPEGEG